MVDNSTISVEQQLQLTNSIAEETKKIIDDSPESLGDFSPVVEVPEDGALVTITYTPEQHDDYFVIQGSEVFEGFDDNNQPISENYKSIYATYTNSDDINSSLAQWTTDGVEEDNWIERQVHYIDNTGSAQQMKVDAAMNSVDEKCVGDMCESGQGDECSVDFTSYSPISNGIHTQYGEVNDEYQGRYEDISFSFLKD